MDAHHCIIEKLSGSGRDDNDTRIPGVTAIRQKKERQWTLTIWTAEEVNDEEFSCLPCIYWLPKMHKISSGA